MQTTISQRINRPATHIRSVRTRRFIVGSSNQGIESDAADLLYKHVVGSLLVSCLASSGLAFICFGQLPAKSLATWWLAMQAVLLLRGLDTVQFEKTKTRRGITGGEHIRRFGYGLAASAILWMSFSLIFFYDLDQARRGYTAVILAGMVGGSATVLAPSRVLSYIYCTCLVIPISVQFFFLPGKENAFLGVLGCTFFIVMSISSGLAHRAAMTAFELSRTNEALAADMVSQRHRAELANAKLIAAQAELEKVNRSLESRIASRTAELEREMQEKETYAKELAHLACTDPLTGLWNRLSLAARLESALARAHMPVAVLFVDLDKFKEVNDAMGHLAGDRILLTISHRLAEVLPPEAELARWGGDEFVVAVPDQHAADLALHLASRLRQTVREPIEVDVGTIMVDATVGIAVSPDHGRTQEDLIRAADVAMYSAKQDRRSKIRLFEPVLSERLTDRLELERALRRAIETKALSLVFQPIIRAKDGRCIALEALLRWKHPQRGFISPGQFIPLAEHTGEIAAIGHWALREACRHAATWWSEGAPAVAVNLSAAQLDSGSLVDEVREALDAAKLPASRLQLELTESVFASDHTDITPALKSLREQGIRVSLDDFGTGFSCLSYLQRLPIDTLKIDKSFVQAVNIDSAPIVRTIVTMSETFGLELVAEGVETRAQAATLLKMGVDHFQGHLYSDAMPPELVLEWLSMHRPVQAEKAIQHAV